MELNNVKGTVGSDVEVLVVGAGPTGLALACDLARRGVRALVVERADRLFPGSRGKGIQPRTMEVFDDLGVAGSVLVNGGPAPVGMAWRGGGERIGAYDMFESTTPTEDQPYSGRPWLLPQWRTQEILRARLDELGGSVQLGCEVVESVQDADGVTVRFGDGGSVRAAYVVAADGGRSTVRAALGIRMHGESVDPAPMLVADVRVRPEALDRDNWHLFTEAPEGLLTLCPLPGTDDFQLVARYADEDSAPDISAEGVRELVGRRSHLSGADVTDVLWSSDFRPRTALAERFRVGRVLLAGDAAHLHSPAGGQGLNTSVQDAYNLGWKLGQVLRYGAGPALLDTYEAERRPVAAEMLGLSTRVHHGKQQRGAATQQLGIGYRGGPLALGAAGVLAAGDRAPDAVLPGGDRLFDAFRGPHFTLLTVGRAGLRAHGAHLTMERAGLGAQGTRSASMSWATCESCAAYETDWLRALHVPALPAYGDGLFLVRPDGYLAWAGDDVDGELDSLLGLFTADVGVRR